ncbi:MAG: 5'-nucleotidase C-terminal domain-containing protein [Clostridiales bacterium]
MFNKNILKYFSFLLCLFLTSSIIFIFKPTKSEANKSDTNYKNSNIELQILGINDFHGQINTTKKISGIEMGRADYLAANLEKRVSENKNTLMVHAGDIVGASAPVSALLNDNPTLEILSEIGFDIGTVGNHEFDKGTDEMLKLTKNSSSFPYTVSNVVYKNTNKTILSPYIIKRVKGIPIGFIGVVLKDTPNMVTAEGISNVNFLDEIDSINKYTKKLKKLGVKTIVILAHVPGYQNNTTGEITGEIAEIANSIDDEVDVIFAGHNHDKINGEVDGKLIVETYSNGTAFSDVDLSINPRTNDVVSKKAEIIDNVQTNIIPDEKITKMIEKYEIEVGPILNEVIGTASIDITTNQNSSGESTLGNFITDAQRIRMDTDFSFMNPGGIRANIEKGEVTWGELFTVQPFNNYLVKMTLTGEDIRTLLNQQWQEKQTRMLQISGLKYTWDSTKPKGEKVIDIFTYDGVKLDSTKEYTITTNSFLAGGGDEFSLFTQIDNHQIGPLDIDVLVDYIKDLGNPFESKIDGRILKIN